MTTLPNIAALAAALTTLGAVHPGRAQEAPATQEAPAAQAEEKFLTVLFPSGSSAIDAGQTATLDQAARTFRDGAPFVMIVSGGADTVGNPERNLDLSLRRAKAVAEQLAARGIPVDRLQVLGRGNSELDVATGEGVAEPKNRSVIISWR